MSRRGPRSGVVWPPSAYHPEGVNLHDWIDEVMDALDIEAEIDEGLVLEVAREAAHQVQRPAAPISTFLLGYAAALAGGRPDRVEELAGRVIDLASKWDIGSGTGESALVGEGVADL